MSHLKSNSHSLTRKCIYLFKATNKDENRDILVHTFTFSNPMLEPLKERTSGTCETHIRGGPPAGAGASLVTQPSNETEMKRETYFKTGCARNAKGTIFELNFFNKSKCSNRNCFQFFICYIVEHSMHLAAGHGRGADQTLGRAFDPY